MLSLRMRVDEAAAQKKNSCWLCYKSRAAFRWPRADKHKIKHSNEHAHKWCINNFNSTANSTWAGRLMAIKLRGVVITPPPCEPRLLRLDVISFMPSMETLIEDTRKNWTIALCADAFCARRYVQTFQLWNLIRLFIRRGKTLLTTVIHFLADGTLKWNTHE